MRGYSWGNMYLSSIQQGIQGWHAQNEIFTKYKINSPEMTTFLKWAKGHKTLMLLNGGYASNIQHIGEVLEKLNKMLKRSPIEQRAIGVKAIPISCFKEEEAALNQALTAIFTVLPETCFCADSTERKKLLKEMSDAGFETPLAAAEFGGRSFSLSERFKFLALCGELAR